jgi:hypothetical protein
VVNAGLRVTATLLLQESVPSTQGTESWMGPRASPEMLAKRKIPVPARNRTLAIQQVASHVTDIVIMARNVVTFHQDLLVDY